MDDDDDDAAASTKPTIIHPSSFFFIIHPFHHPHPIPFQGPISAKNSPGDRWRRRQKHMASNRPPASPASPATLHERESDGGGQSCHKMDVRNADAAADAARALRSHFCSRMIGLSTGNKAVFCTCTPHSKPRIVTFPSRFTRVAHVMCGVYRQTGIRAPQTDPKLRFTAPKLTDANGLCSLDRALQCYRANGPWALDTSKVRSCMQLSVPTSRQHPGTGAHVAYALRQISLPVAHLDLS